MKIVREQALDWSMAALLILHMLFMQLVSAPVLAIGLSAVAAIWVAAVPVGQKPMASAILAIVIGFYTAEWISGAIKDYTKTFSSSAELAASLSRFGLVGYLVPLALTACWFPLRTKLLAVGNLSKRIRMPSLLGNVSDPIWRVLLIAMLANIAVFYWLIDWRELTVQPAVWFWSGLLFAWINASLETVLWRGFVLSRCIDAFGVMKGIIICGAAFGLYHYSFIQDWRLCVLFGFGGIALGWLAWKSGGLLAPWLLHFALNVLFVLSGMII